MDTSDYMYASALIVLILLPVLAIYSDGYKDNLVQRIGLSLISFGSVFRLWGLLYMEELPGPRYLMTYGFAIYGVGIVGKEYVRQRRIRKIAKSHPSCPYFEDGHL